MKRRKILWEDTKKQQDFNLIYFVVQHCTLLEALGSTMGKLGKNTTEE